MDMTALERLGLSPAATQAYLSLLDHGMDVSALDATVAAELEALGLAHRTEGRWEPESARPMLEALASRTQREVDTMRTAADALARAYERHPGMGRGAIDVVHGREAVGTVYDEMLRQASTVVRGLDRGPYINDVGTPGEEQRAAMSRGVEFRVIYETPALGDDRARQILRDCLVAGEISRVLPRLPMKLILADEQIAMIALATASGGGEALLIRPSLLLEALIELFDQFWEMALPAGHSEADGDVKMLLNLLAAGLTDESLARELGISVRTVQRRITHLHQQLGATTRFQLGIQASRRGWL